MHWQRDISTQRLLSRNCSAVIQDLYSSSIVNGFELLLNNGHYFGDYC